MIKDWTNTDWKEGDVLYHPKRRVDNKISWQRPHIIGSFFSNKMKRTVEYHSLNECFFYYLLELDRSVIRYYVQPIEVKIQIILKNGERKNWLHVPDVLVFKNGYKPLLYQIKETPADVGSSFEQNNKNCMFLASKNGWHYEVIYPKTLPSAVLWNLNYLHGFLRTRRYYSQLREDVLFKVRTDSSVTIGGLANSFFSSFHPNDVKPFIHHLIATGILETNIYQEVNSNSVVHIAVQSEGYPISKLLFGHGELRHES